MQSTSFAHDGGEGHSLLFLKQKGVDGVRKSVASDAFARKVADGVLARADGLMRLPPLRLEREAGREVILPTSRALSDRVVVLGMAAMLTGNHLYRRRGIDELVNVAGFSNWNPSHFLDVAEMACGFAIGVDWLSAGMTPAERLFFDDALAEKALLPGLDQLRAGAFWTSAAHNWNVVCCGGLIVAALVAGARHAGPAQEVVARSTAAIAHGMSSFDVDGGYAEGPGYWELAARYAVLALAALDEKGMTVPDLRGLAASWRFNRETTAPSGACFDYGDTVQRLARSPILGRLAGLDGRPEAAAWQRAAPGELHPFDLVWLAQDQRPDPPGGQSATSFDGAGICVLRNSSGAWGTYVGFKGGRNSVNHAHLDLGSFVLEVGKSRFVSELGRDDYALPGYFDPDRRFGYFRLGTAGHGTVMIDGQAQSPAAQARCLGISDLPDFVAAAFEIEDDRSPVSHRRGIAITDDCVWVVDEFLRKRQTTPEAIRIDWRLFSEAEIAHGERVATLRIGEQLLSIRTAESDGIAWAVDPVASPPGEADNSGFSCLRFETRMTSDAKRICVAITTGGGVARNMPQPIDAWPLRLTGNAS